MSVASTPPVIGLPEAIARAVALAARPGRSLLGITGPPGAGKSTVAEAVVRSVPGAVLVGMDGFHLAHRALEAAGLVDVKGAPQTFDADGYVALLRRVRSLGTRGTVWAPQFRREIEDAVAGAVAVRAQTPLVVTEGNYLLLDEGPWASVRGLLDECWFLDLPDAVRRDRLAARHRAYGRSVDDAWHRTLGSDESNALLVVASRTRADVLVG